MSGRLRMGSVLVAGFLVGGIALRLWIGRDPNSGTPTLEWPTQQILALRMGAIWSALLAGGCLGLSGLLLQSLLRNPLAAPFILGLSAGAGLATVLTSWAIGLAGASSPAWIAMIAAGADGVLPGTIGAVSVLAIVYLLGRRSGQLDPLTLVLAGTVVSTICGALTLLVQSLMPPESRGESWLWFMGQIPEVPAVGAALTALGVLIISLSIGSRLALALDAASTSDDEARSLGVSLGQLRVVLFLCAGALASASVALCGPIAFVGFVAPHMCRQLIGSRHRGLVMASTLAGAGILVWADAIRQALDFGAGRLPVGVLTALLGGPVFLLVLRRSRSRVGEWRC